MSIRSYMCITNLVDHAAFSSRLRYNAFMLHKGALSASGILQGIQAVWCSHSFEIYKCLEDVKALERELEVC